jgi:DNA ligase (NAD+)
VERGGDVIPKVAEVIEDADHPRGKKKFVFPRFALSAESKVVREEGEVDWRCVNADCPAKLRESLLHFGRARRDEHRGAGRRGGGTVADRGWSKALPISTSLDEEHRSRSKRS